MPKSRQYLENHNLIENVEDIVVSFMLENYNHFYSFSPHCLIKNEYQFTVKLFFFIINKFEHLLAASPTGLVVSFFFKSLNLK